MHTSFAVDPHKKMLSIFGIGWSANLVRDLFMSEHSRVNLLLRNKLYQLSYLMLIERSIDGSLIAFVDVTKNPPEYLYKV